MGKYDWNSLKQNLQKGLEKKESSYDDPREWKLQRDENDNGTAVIRLLPGKGGDTPPIVRIYEHSLKFFNKPSGKYRYYIESSPASIDEPCPVSEIWYELGDIGTEEAKQMQRKFGRSVKFISNILVVKDPANPENEGKVFYWKYGVKLFEKFKAALEPTEAQMKVGKKPIQLFDPEEGANIILEVKRVGDFVNYDDTSIESPSRILDSDEEIEDIVMNKCYDLTEFISKDYYKPYEELRKKIAWVIEKTPEEAYLVAHGSKVITEPYTKGSGSNKTETGSVGDYTYKPKSTEQKEAAPKEVAPKTEKVTESKTEEAPPKVEEKETPKPKTEEVDIDKEILDMIDDL